MATQDPTIVPSLTKTQTKAPRGLVLGPDGKPCKPCTAFRNWRPPASTTGKSQSKEPEKARNATAASMMAALAGGTAVASYTRPDEPPPNCPADGEQLGRATWTFLHTTAAYYPDKPTTQHRVNMLALLRSLPILYPCSWCADDFGKDISVHPPDVSSRERLSKWLCERHNEVNEKLGKSSFDCSTVDERWKDGPSDGSCD